MKVLVLIESAVSSRYWEASIPLLAEKGVDVSFATTREKGELSKFLEEKNISVFAFDAKNVIDYPKVIWRLASLIRKEKFDIVNASEPIQATIAGFACLFARSTKCIFHYHHTRVTGKQKILNTIGSRLSDMILTVSKTSQNAAVQFDKTPLKKVFVAYNGINELRSVSNAEKINLRKKLHIPDNARIISIVSHLRKVKGHETLIKACRIVAKQSKDPTHLIIVGDGTEKQSLLETCKNISEFNTHLVGHQEDIGLWFSFTDVVAMPSYFESFGLAAVEAMICRKPLVASNIEGLAEIIEPEKSGILVPPKDANALAEAILRVFENPEFARKLGENAHKRVQENFTMNKMVDGWIDCYNFVLQNNKK